jgi:hypothetical protein
MDKLTINELKGYLGTGLKIMENDDDGIFEMLGIYDFEEICTDGGDIPFTNFKPLLYPLSSLTEYREDLGFVPIERLLQEYCFDTKKMSKEEILSYSVSLIEIDISYKTALRLHEWHIDVHNLIDRNLAINIKTLKQ